MFTGIVETAASAQSCDNGRLIISNPWSVPELHLGQSVSVAGCCLTVVEFSNDRIAFDVSPETLARTKFRGIRNGDPVNLERGLKIGDALDGHLVTGHVDATGTVRSVENLDLDAKRIWVDAESLRWIVEKGSVSIDGVSLTVNDVDDHGFSFVLIPHTLSITSLSSLKPSDLVNIEFDLVAKYIERILGPYAEKLKERCP
ncbi:MAG: riboflavin synthase [Pseudomonadota bacterium]